MSVREVRFRVGNNPFDIGPTYLQTRPSIFGTRKIAAGVANNHADEAGAK